MRKAAWAKFSLVLQTGRALNAAADALPVAGYVKDAGRMISKALVPMTDTGAREVARQRVVELAGGVAGAIGDLPQNVNFAIRGEIAKLFLSQNGVEPKLGNLDEAIAPVELAEQSAKFTVFC